MKKNIQNRQIAIIFILLCFLSIACSKRKTILDSVSLDVKRVPLMHSEKVSSLISDSGITRYRLIAEIWDVYDQPDNPQNSYWYFPEGFYVENFDSIFNIEWNVKSDTAYYYDKKQLWHLTGNVEVMNLQKVKFETQELFWDEKTHKIYSNKKIRIEQPDRITLGVGFESNQTMTEWDIFKSEVINMTETENDTIMP